MHSTKLGTAGSGVQKACICSWLYARLTRATRWKVLTHVAAFELCCFLLNWESLDGEKRGNKWKTKKKIVWARNKCLIVVESASRDLEAANEQKSLFPWSRKILFLCLQHRPTLKLHRFSHNRNRRHTGAESKKRELCWRERMLADMVVTRTCVCVVDGRVCWIRTIREEDRVWRKWTWKKNKPNRGNEGKRKRVCRRMLRNIAWIHWIKWEKLCVKKRYCIIDRIVSKCLSHRIAIDYWLVASLNG